MKKYMRGLCIFMVSFFSVYSYIPFNALIDTKCKLELFNDDKNLIKGSIRMFEQKKDKDDKPIKNNYTLKLNDYFSNSVLDLNKKTVTIYDKNWQPTNYTLKSPQTWVDWDKEDDDANRLFRYFMFYDVMGMMEGPFRELSKECRENYIKNYALRSDALGQKSDFELKKVGDLEKEFKEYKKNNVPAKNPGSIEVLDFYKIWKNEGLMIAFEKTDIRALQESNPGAWFQLASTFRSLEGGVHEQGLEHMNTAPVQGENAVATTMGAGIVRTYLIPEDERYLLRNFSKNHVYKAKDIENIEVGIHENVVVTSGYYPPFVRTSDYKDQFEKVINQVAGLIKNNDKLAQSIRAGADVYLDFNKDTSKMTDVEKELQELYKKSEQQIKESNQNFNFDRLEFLLRNNLVKTNRNPIYVFNKAIKRDDIKVTQVFTATIRYEEGKFTDEQKDNAKIILKGMYKGTVLAAASGGCKKLFLTLVGTGAFGNEIAWVMDALNDPEIIEAIRYTGMKVWIVLFHDIRGGRSIKDKPFDNYEKNKALKKTAYEGIYDAVNELNKKISKSIDNFARALKSIGSK